MDSHDDPLICCFKLCNEHGKIHPALLISSTPVKGDIPGVVTCHLEIEAADEVFEEFLTGPHALCKFVVKGNQTLVFAVNYIVQAFEDQAFSGIFILGNHLT